MYLHCSSEAVFGGWRGGQLHTNDRGTNMSLVCYVVFSFQTLYQKFYICPFSTPPMCVPYPNQLIMLAFTTLICSEKYKIGLLNVKVSLTSKHCLSCKFRYSH